MALSRRYEEVLARHMAIVELQAQGLPAMTIARSLGLGHCVVLYHMHSHCKCLPRDGYRKDPILLGVGRELRAIEDRVLACEASGVKTDYLLVQALRRALILVGEKPRVG